MAACSPRRVRAPTPRAISRRSTVPSLRTGWRRSAPTCWAVSTCWWSGARSAWRTVSVRWSRLAGVATAEDCDGHCWGAAGSQRDRCRRRAVSAWPPTSASASTMTRLSEMSGWSSSSRPAAAGVPRTAPARSWRSGPTAPPLASTASTASTGWSCSMTCSPARYGSPPPSSRAVNGAHPGQPPPATPNSPLGPHRPAPPDPETSCRLIVDRPVAFAPQHRLIPAKGRYRLKHRREVRAGHLVLCDLGVVQRSQLALHAAI